MLASFASLIDVPRYVVPVHGPERWWSGPLNTERLALDSVQCAAVAANSVQSDAIAGIRADLVAANFASIGHLKIGGERVTPFAELSGYFRCAADGWIRTHGNYPHHAAALARATG
ncbi:MAG: hypothetical protein J2O48_10695, partial [Solirubrobacterales bacterium]|nr:hypothetical protein [Solirubrobacterales bacterium]